MTHLLRRLTSSRSFVVSLLVGTATVLGSACATEHGPDRGGLMVIVSEDAPLGLDRLRLEVSSGANVLRRDELLVPEQVTLPTTLGIASNGDPTASVHVSVSGFRAGQPVDRRDELVQQIPVDRVAALTIVLSARCSPLVFIDGADARSRCAEGQTCDPVAGACGGATIDASTLPTYSEGAENDASGPPVTGSDGDVSDVVTPPGDAGPDAPAGCQAGQKSCGAACVGTDDPAFGCASASCAPCSVDPESVMSCVSGACQLTGCSAGYKICGGKCVSIKDPTYGCGLTTCDATPCPALDGGTGTLVCQNDNTCVIGTCGAGTKKCGSKCVPTDRNNGCESAASCTACTASETCQGAPKVCTCVPDNVTPCQFKACGTVKNNCGVDISCGDCKVAGESCGGGGIQFQCGCTDEPLTTTCSGKACGPATNNCGHAVWCPSTCTGVQTCDPNTFKCVDPPSCLGLGAGQATCGQNAESCCVNAAVPGGTFNRHNDPSYPATVAPFRLDRYEVTVKRYQAFKYAWGTQGWRPAMGAGKHQHIPGGLNGNELGWDTAWVTDSLMHVTSADFDTFLGSCTKSSWSAGTGDLPINCVSWWEAFAFCIWDDGFLPSAAEWNFAAAGGSEQRQWPWASGYNGGTPWSIACVSGPCTGGVSPVGQTNYGVAKWSQWDLSGNVFELSADRPSVSSFAPPVPCVNCADMSSGVKRIAHGGSWVDNYNYVTTYYDTYVTTRSDQIGFRCARLP